MKHKIKVVIVGDGIAGWMCAATLVKRCGNNISEINLVQQPKVNNLGIETSLPSFKQFNASIGIDEQEFMYSTHATFSLGTKFNDWGKIGNSYFQPFGIYGDCGDNIDFLNHWLRSTAKSNPQSLADYSYCINACKQDLFDFPQTDPEDIKSTYAYGYQFNAQCYVDYLKEKVSELITVIPSAVNKVQVNKKTEYIDSILLDSGEKITADYFIDCTDTSALLIEKTLGVEQINCANHLPCNRILSVMSDKLDKDLSPYSISKANSAGWQWQCHSQQHTNHTYIYHSGYISDEQAFAELVSGLDEQTLSSPRFSELKSAYRQEAWRKNCIAIGNSAAIIDPLESGSLYLIQQAIQNLIDLFPNKIPQPTLAEEYNRRMQDAYLQTKDLLTSHYFLNQRTDSQFWQDCQKIPLPPTLALRLQLFEKRAYLDGNISAPFSADNWISVLLGQGLVPKAVNPLYYNVPIETVEKKLAMVLTNIEDGIANMPSHQQFIANYCTVQASKI